MLSDLQTWNRIDSERRARARKRGAKAYSFFLRGSQECLVWVGAARNVKCATAAIAELFGEKPVAVRVHPLSDPWPHPMPKTTPPPMSGRAA